MSLHVKGVLRSVALGVAAVTLGAMALRPAEAADSLKIGFIGTPSGPAGMITTQALAAFQLGLDQHQGRLGGVPVTLLVGDDQQKTDLGRQWAEKFLLSDKVDFLVASAFSNVLLAFYPLAVENKKVIFSVTAGPSQIAGKGCSPYFFNTSWQGDNLAEAMGAYLQKQAVPGVYTLAPNYAAGKDVITGFKRFYKGPIVGERFTPLTQLDFAPELAELRAANPPALFAFYPGGLGIQFLKQYNQSGLNQTLKLYTAYLIDDTTFPAIGDAANGDLLTVFWSTTMDNPQNKAFVAAYKAKTREVPSFYAAPTYDAATILDTAVRSVGGNLADTGALVKAIETAKFASLRGKFKFANDHFPVQDYYLGQVQKGGDGVPEIALRELVMADYGNAYQQDCEMK